MANKLLLPQEIETFYIIPALRRYFANYMKEAGMKQKDIAQILNINSAAISQYTNHKRGNKIDFNEAIIPEIKKSAGEIKDTHSYLKETQRILNVIREKKEICRIHKLFSDLPDNCHPEVVGCLPLKRGCI